MEKHDEAELRIIEVKGTLSAPQARRPVPPKLRRSAPTPAKALEDLRSMKGAAALIKSLPALGNPAVWGETAFWSVNEIRGAAFDPFFWDCDFFSNGFSLEWASANSVVKFWGTEPVDSLEPIDIIPPQNLTGQVWCDLKVPTSGYYLFAAHVGTEGTQPDYFAYVEFCLDYSSLGLRRLEAGSGLNQYFLLNLAAGIHRFIIKQVSGVFYFRTLTAWSIPISQDVPTVAAG